MSRKQSNRTHNVSPITDMLPEPIQIVNKETPDSIRKKIGSQRHDIKAADRVRFIGSLSPSGVSAYIYSETTYLRKKLDITAPVRSDFVEKSLKTVNTDEITDFLSGLLVSHCGYNSLKAIQQVDRYRRSVYGQNGTGNPADFFEKVLTLLDKKGGTLSPDESATVNGFIESFKK